MWCASLNSGFKKALLTWLGGIMIRLYVSELEYYVLDLNLFKSKPKLSIYGEMCILTRLHLPNKQPIILPISSLRAFTKTHHVYYCYV